MADGLGGGLDGSLGGSLGELVSPHRTPAIPKARMNPSTRRRARQEEIGPGPIPLRFREMELDPNDPAAGRRYQEYKLPDNLTVAQHRAYDYSPHLALGLPTETRPAPPKLFDIPTWIVSQNLGAPVGKKFVRAAGLNGIEKLEAKLSILHRKIVIDIFRGAFGYMVQIPLPHPENPPWGVPNLGEGRAMEDAKMFAAAQATCDELWPTIDGRSLNTLSWDEIRAWCFHELPLEGIIYEHYRPDLTKYSTRTEHRIAFLCLGTDRGGLAYPPWAHAEFLFQELYDKPIHAEVLRMAKLIARAILHGPLEKLENGMWREVDGLAALEGVKFAVAAERQIGGLKAGMSEEERHMDLIPELSSAEETTIRKEGVDLRISRVGWRIMNLTESQLDYIVVRFKSRLSAPPRRGKERFQTLGTLNSIQEKHNKMARTNKESPGMPQPLPPEMGDSVADMVGMGGMGPAPKRIKTKGDMEKELGMIMGEVVGMCSRLEMAMEVVSHQDLVEMLEVLEGGGGLAAGGKAELIQKIKRSIMGCLADLGNPGMVGIEMQDGDVVDLP